MGFMSVFTMSAKAGGIHCDDDPKCLPCVGGETCHNHIVKNSGQSATDQIVLKFVINPESNVPPELTVVSQ